MRITIEVPDPPTSSSSPGALPSVTTDPGAAVSGAMSDAMSGGAGPSPSAGVAVALVDDAASAGAAEQYHDEIASSGATDGANDGGPAPA